MGREFVDIFDEWAEESYEASVSGEDPEYRDVFIGYDNILNEVAKRVSGTVVEFGTGTGNLTLKLIEAGFSVIGIEPNTKMRQATAKRFPSIDVMDGDLIQFEAGAEHIDAFVSTYVFHHLTDVEKGIALNKYAELLPSNGKVVFADTAFTTEDAKQAQIRKERKRGFHHVADDLEREYYTTIPILSNLFEEAGFEINFTRMNDFVWLMDAIKK
ncbi:class I SAM-dependent methyltransferase [Bacillus sp. FJAT-22090]|uniref:class I SAM-dependent DNA methyltransferase n=1 Tax=Bacillus sp. FJAT-22090 TaxID=1581038 RepID=UPI0011A2B72C|nr:class I SAM-dependent methyltransferase [Bacillus sp. FJAT-22090]